MFHSFIKNSSKQILFVLLFFTLGCSSNVKENILGFDVLKINADEFKNYRDLNPNSLDILEIYRKSLYNYK